MIRVGDRVRRTINVTDKSRHGNTVDGMEYVPRNGVVIWVHPKKRFYTAEFTIGQRKVRESYFMDRR